jgi:hypothetical protein
MIPIWVNRLQRLHGRGWQWHKDFASAFLRVQEQLVVGQMSGLEADAVTDAHPRVGRFKESDDVNKSLAGLIGAKPTTEERTRRGRAGDRFYGECSCSPSDRVRSSGDSIKLTVSSDPRTLLPARNEAMGAPLLGLDQ